MSKQYVDIPLYTTFNAISKKGYSLSATQYKSFCIKNKNVVTVKKFLNRELRRSDLGSEVGSDAYVEGSNFFFVKTKALQAETYLLDIDKESVPNITPMSYVDSDLKQGDLLISKDSNVGEIVILDKDYPNTMLCSGIYKLPVTDNKYYLLAFVKNDIFRQQIDYLVPRGSTIRHGKTKFLDCLIPIPNKNSQNTIKYVELLTEAIINKEIEIKTKYNQIIGAIQTELESNQKESVYQYAYPTFKEISSTTRLDSALYSQNFKNEEFLLDNYTHGTASIQELGFDFIRGNNLAVSVIGRSAYLDEYCDNCYMLILPQNISKYGTLTRVQYLGNKNKLLTLKKGSIVFGAEGTFRSLLFMDNVDAITNFHGLTVYNKNDNLQESVFVKEMLDYFRERNICRACATGGNGGSLSIEYWKYLKFPLFPDDVKKTIVAMYHNPSAIYDASEKTLETFMAYDSNYNKMAGIYELDQSMKFLQRKLDEAIACIADDVEVTISF